jgi:CheY-like chemotaxis protein
MTRILLIHWNVAEAHERVDGLRALGFEASYHADQNSASMRSVREEPPDAFAIDLNRLPSRGLGVATWIRQQKATRHVPLVFVEGDEEKTARIRDLLPDAIYAKWESVAVALREAIANPPTDPVVPGTMDSYATTPLPRKLGIKPGTGVILLESPPDFEETLGGLPEGAKLMKTAEFAAPVVLLFVTSRNELEQRFRSAADALSAGGRLWIVWPKKASGVASDLTQNKIRAFGLNAGFVDYKISAIDRTWSGLCFARKKRS